MLELLNPETEVDIRFDRENLAKLSKYFDLDFLDSSLEQKSIFFKNLYTLSRRSLGLAHNIQHHQTAYLAVQLSQCQAARDRVLNQPWGQLIGCCSVVKHSDEITMTDHVLQGEKRWLSNLESADYGFMQIEEQGVPYIVYFDLHTMPHTKSYDYFTPIGMELARPGALIFDQVKIDPSYVLGVKGTQEFFQQSSFSNYCFLTNHYGLIKQLFLDVRQYATKHACGAEFELKKLEIDVCTLQMMWEENLSSLNETELTHVFWNRRNTQYAFSKKTLVNIIQLVLELGVSYYTDAKSPFSQRFRDSLTYASHMHPLYRFGQEFYMVDLEK